MENARIAAVLDETADLLELDGANAFRVRAYRNAAHLIEALTESVADRVRADKASLAELKGIGADLADKIAIIVETGELPLREELRARIPQGVVDLMRVPGMGPKKAAILFKELGVQSIADLQAACEAQRVRTVKGFGKKTEEAVLAALPNVAASNTRLPWFQVDSIAQEIAEHIRQCGAVERMAFAGSYRRGRDTLGDLDLLVTTNDPVSVTQHFVAYPGVTHTLAQGESKCSVRLRNGFQVDLRVVAKQSFGAALQYFTGSKEHNVHLRGMAKDRGYTLNEYGIFKGDEPLGGAEETEIYTALGLTCFPPELREDRWEFGADIERLMAEWIDLSHLVGDLHMHTTATDGAASLQEMANAAIARGYQYIAITDHSQRVSMARGLTPERVLEQWEQIDELNHKLGGKLLVLKGIEVDILEAGGLDLPDEVLAQADWVVASVHYGQTQSREQITTRIVDALAHPSVCAIAHPTGRLLGKRPAYAVDLEAVYDAAARHGKFLELNANPMRLDLDDLACAAASARGIPIVVSSDAHSVNGLDVLHHGIRQARRAGLTKDKVLNTRPWAEIQQMLRRR